MAQRLIETLAANRRRLNEESGTPEISPAETVLIRLGGLLHDITHVPFSHDIEKKTHKIGKPSADAGNGVEPYRVSVQSYYGHYEKHDEYKKNPALYLLLTDTARSLLARVLREYSAKFYEQLQRDAKAKKEGNARFPHISQFFERVEKTTWSKIPDSVLPAMLFHLLFYEKPDEAKDAVRSIAVGLGENGDPITENWGLGPNNDGSLHKHWYRSYRHDIIGDTLSADLLDYLTRDPQRLALNRKINTSMLSHYVMRQVETVIAGNARDDDYRCAIDLRDSKRGTTRMQLLNDVFRLLDLRHEIHEKAVAHRVVQSANSMLARALLIMREEKVDPPTILELVGLGDLDCSLRGEDALLFKLIQDTKDYCPSACHLLRKLAERRVYRPLVIIPGDRAIRFKNANLDDETYLRVLAIVADAAYYAPFFLYLSSCIEEYLQGVVASDTDLCARLKKIGDDADDAVVERAMKAVSRGVITWATPYKQLYKEPGLIVHLDHRVERLDHYARSIKKSVEHMSGLERSVHTSIEEANCRYAGLWKLYVFISDGLYYSGTLRKMRKLCGIAVDDPPHQDRLNNACHLIWRGLNVVISHWMDMFYNGLPQEQWGEVLSKSLPTTEFKRLVRELQDKYQNITRNTGFSAVKLDHYCHDQGVEDELHDSKCRDIQYKFDLKAKDAVEEHRKSSMGSQEHTFVEYLEAAGLLPSHLDALDRHEYLDTFERFKSDPTYARCIAALNAMKNNGSATAASRVRLLDLLWSDATSGLPVSGADTKTKDMRRKLSSTAVANRLRDILGPRAKLSRAGRTKEEWQQFLGDVAGSEPEVLSRFYHLVEANKKLVTANRPSEMLLFLRDQFVTAQEQS